MRSQYCFKQKTGTIIAIIVLIFVFVYISTVAYSAINSTMTITGDAIARIEKNIRISNVKLLSVEGGGVELYSPDYSVNTITTGIDLKSLDSKVTYQITIVNSGNEDMTINSIYKQTYYNYDIVFDCNFETYTNIPAGSTQIINITYRYDSSVTSLPSETTLEGPVYFEFDNLPEPVLASRMNWYRGSTDRSLITSISFADKYEVPSELSVIESWDASDGEKKSVTAYVLSDYSLVLSSNGEGNGKVFANSDSMYAFGYSNESYGFVNCSVIDTSLLDTSKVTNMDRMFGYAGYFAESTEIKGLDKFDVSNVISMAYMFSYVGYNSKTLNISGLDDWNTSKVTRMDGLFSNIGYLSTTWSIGYLSGWDTGSVIYMNNMFENAGYSAPIWTVGVLGAWNTSNVINMSYMFSFTAYSANEWGIGHINNWDVSKVQTFSYMFRRTAYSSDIFDLGDIGGWNISNVKYLNWMFFDTAPEATYWNIGQLDNWDTSQVTTMDRLFMAAGKNSTVWDIGDLSGWDTSKVTNMDLMFQETGQKLKSWSVGDISNWDVSSLKTARQMFQYINNLEVLDLSGWNTSSLTDTSFMFCSCSNLTTIYIGDGWDVSNVTSSSSMFGNSSKLPNFDTSVYDVTKAHGGEGGYMTHIIKFTIEGTTYKALKGMTWNEWLSSEYNTSTNLKSLGFCVGTSDWNYYVVRGDIMIDPGDVISSGDYQLKLN